MAMKIYDIIKWVYFIFINNFYIHIEDVTNSRRPIVTQLTPTKPNVTAMVMEVSLKTPDTIIIGTNDRDPKYNKYFLKLSILLKKLICCCCCCCGLSANFHFYKI